MMEMICSTKIWMVDKKKKELCRYMYEPLSAILPKEIGYHLGSGYFMAWCWEWDGEQQCSFRIYGYSGISIGTPTFIHCKIILTVKCNKLRWKRYLIPLKTAT